MRVGKTQRRVVGKNLGMVLVCVLVFGSLSASISVSASISTHAATRTVVLSSRVTKPAGATVFFAEAPLERPNYIFPFAPPRYDSYANRSQFQFLLYRPLYWFGSGNQPQLNTSLSLAKAPQFADNDTVVHIELQSYKWSDGESVDATDVMFWMNMLKVEKTNWLGYQPGAIPDDVRSVIINSPGELTLTLTSRVNSEWFTYDELSQITPMPLAWDITKMGAARGSGGCAKATYSSIILSHAGVATSNSAKACAAVFNFLSRQSGFIPSAPRAANNVLKTYATNSLWQIVDGPWHLAAFNAAGHAVFKANAKYSGPVKASLGAFVELPFSSDAAEYAALVSGKLTVGYLLFDEVTAVAKDPEVPGANAPRLAKKFNLVPQYRWAIDYFPYNFNSTGEDGQAGKIFRQLYIRTAFQSLIDQPLFIQRLFKGYAAPTFGPVPLVPLNGFDTRTEAQDPRRFQISTAIDDLDENGWTVHPGGTTVCGRSGGCTGDIPKGTPLSFTMQYVASGPTAQNEAVSEQAEWELAGINVSLSTATLGVVTATAKPCHGSSCTWELENWSGASEETSENYPSGEKSFESGAVSNTGSYSDATNDALIRASVGDGDISSLFQWENYFAQQAPVVWQPAPAFELVEVQKGLRGVVPLNPLLTVNPEDWTFQP